LDYIKSSKKVSVNKVGILILGTIAPLIGFAPAAFLIGRLESIIFFAVATLIGASLAVKSFKSSATEKPSLLEHIIGSINIIFWGVLTSGFFLIVFLIFFGILFGVELLTNFLFGWQMDEFFISYVISLIIAIIVGLVWGEEGTKDYAKQLYPNKARVKSAFYEIANRGKRKLFKYFGSAFLVLGIIMVAVWLTTGSLDVWNVWWFNIILLVYLLFLSASTFQGSKGFDPELPDAIAAVKKLLEVNGYSVVPSPITGKEEFDPFLSALDFFAQKKGESLAITVRTAESKNWDLWRPSHLLRSTWALETFSQEEQETKLNVTPVVISIGEMNEKWPEKIKVIKLPKQNIPEILSIKKKKKLKDIANYYLRFSDADKDLSEAKDKNNISGVET